MKKEKPQMNLVVIGHVDAGKSTSTGHLIYLNGGIDQRTLDKYRKEAELIGKGSFCFAWILDTLKSERDRGITIKATLNKFETAKNQYTIIDAPGHRDFIKNMITGTTQADAAVLVVSAQGGEFEAGISPDGQTKEHALLAYTLGVKEMIVAVNKMDHPSVKYSEERFNEVVSESKIFLKNAGYKPDKITFVPISGWTGENLKEKSDNLAWYKGPTLMVALDSLPQPERPTALPLRLPINDVYKISGVGTVACGRVETGTLKKDTLLSFCPGKVQGDCRSIEKHHEEVDEACPGDNIGFNVRGVDAKVLKKGTVVSDARNKPASEVTDFLAHVVILNHPNEINSGYTPVVDCHAAHVACRFNELKQKVDKRSGKVIEENPKSIKNGDAALVQLIPQKPMCVEIYKEFAPLGRFAVRDMKQTVAVGIIKECTRKTESLKK